MEYIVMCLVFIWGLAIGSFLNVVIFRLGTSDSIVSARSKCLGCGHVLVWYDLVPVLSFLSLAGKCRYCKRKISWQYIFVEIVTGILFIFAFERTFSAIDFLAGFSFLGLLGFFLLIFIFSALVVIFVYDFRHYIIPDEVVYPAIVAAFFWAVLDSFLTAGKIDPSFVLNILGAAVLASGFFLFLIMITDGKGMGGGDVKLGFLMGLGLGFPNILLALFLAFIFGAVAGVFLMAFGKKEMKSMIPFGPFLIIGFLISFFYGTPIIDWYWNSLVF